MRLTNTMRDAFVLAAMNDVPKVDYQEEAEKIAKDHLDLMFKQTFPGLDRKELELSGWLTGSVRVELPGSLDSVYTQAPSYGVLRRETEVWKKLNEIAIKHNEQRTKLLALRSNLKAVASSVTTRNALLAALPEFEKYLPADERQAIKTLPAVANIVSDFVKAGWPKTKAVAA